MEKSNIESPLNRSGSIIERESIVLHQTSEDIISEYEGLTNNNKDLEAINIDNANKKEDLPHKNSIKEKISERLSIISSTLKNEKVGMLYCLLAHFLWTSNSIYLKFLTQYFGNKFKNKTFLFSRGLMTVLISYFLGLYQEGKILKLTELPKNILRALLIRMNFNFFSMSIWVVSVWYLRISTCQIISTLSPIVIIFFSIIFLGEKYYSRYAYGVILGILGSSIIVLNENKIPSVEEKESKAFEIFLGVFCNFLSMITGGIEGVCNKIMAKEKTPITSQMFYVGCSHCVYSFLWMLFTNDFDYTVQYFFMCMLHAILFFSGFYMFNKGLQLIDLSKTSIIQYSKIVFVFILSTIFLGQKVFFSDIVGSIIIVSFMIYHMMNPVK
jgi:drug/metabolite transporter (DMT)-like permease